MRTIIVGLHNPYSHRPEDALAPYPDNSAGHRLWRMLSWVYADDKHVCYDAIRASYDRRLYMSLFERCNLFGSMEYVGSRKLAKEKAFAFFVEKRPAEGDVVVLLGLTVLQAFGDAGVENLKKIMVHPQVWNGITWRWLPHPSGRSHAYNDPCTKMLAGMMLADLITQQENSRCREA